MNLEKRIAALEEELKVLKGEVQHVLLEIKEYLLEARYPDLSGFQGNQVQIGSTPPIPQSRNGHSRYKEPDGNESHWPSSADSLAKALGTLTAAGSDQVSKLEHAERPLNGKEAQLQDLDLAFLARWVNNAVRQLGRQHTQQVIDLWARSQGLPDSWGQLLHALVTMAPEPDEKPEPGLEQIAQALVELHQIGTRA